MKFGRKRKCKNERTDADVSIDVEARLRCLELQARHTLNPAEKT